MDPSGPLPSRRRRWPRRIALVLVLAALGYGGLWLYGVWDASRQYDRLIADLDAREPGWQFADRMATGKVIPADRNAAAAVNAAKARLPAGWPGREVYPLLELKDEPNLRLSEADRKALETELTAAAAALAEARRLPDLPEGRFDADWTSEDWLPARSDRHVQMPRSVAALLRLEGMRLAHDGRPDDAARLGVGTLHAGRSLSPDPGTIPVLVRLACRAIAVFQVEHALAQGTVSPETLRLCTAAFREDENSLSALDLLLGERAFFHACLADARAGKFAADDLPKELFSKSGHTHALRGFTELVDIVRQHQDEPWLTLRSRFPNWDRQLMEEKENAGPMTRLTGPGGRYHAKLFLAMNLGSLERVLASLCEGKARLRCAVAALAAEDYRLKHGRWPSRPEDLVPEFLPEWPADPIDGEPLRWLRRADGITVYSIGRDGKDDGGLVPGDRNAGDAGFRLWDADKRGQSPKAVEKTDG